MLDRDELAAAFSPKTKAIIINTPHNPLGKVVVWWVRCLWLVVGCVCWLCRFIVGMS